MAISQIAFRDRQDNCIICQFDGDKVLLSNGEVITESANAHRKRTFKGDNLKVAKITRKNWQAAARAYCDKIGYFKSVDTLEAERLDFDNPPAGIEETEAPFEFIQDWAKSENPMGLTLSGKRYGSR